MTKNRLEAFSDGVFAIVITLLILEVKVPLVDKAQLNSSLVVLMPKILSFILSFVVVGSYWVAHHTMMAFVEKVDRSVLWFNLLILLTVAFIPFPTALLGEYTYVRTPVILYGISLSLVNITGTIFWIYVTYKNRFVKNTLSKKFSNFVGFIHLIPVLFYLLSIGLSFISITLSYIIYFLVPLFFILPNPLILKRINTAYQE